MAKQRKKEGLPPGSIVFTGDQKVDKVLIHYLKYNEEQLEEQSFHSHDNIIFPEAAIEVVDWYDMRGLHNTTLIESLGKSFNIHALILEDIADTNQRPKYEEYEKGNFISIKALFFDKKEVTVKTEQISIYFNQGLLLSFQEDETDIFAAVRQRLELGRGRIRQRGADYLAYALIDNIVDNYYQVINEVEAVIELLEDQLLSDPGNNLKGKIHHLKKELLIIRKSILPLREAISQFAKSDSPFIEDRTTIFVRDIYDHTVQVMDMIETYRDMLNGLQDLYLSEISFKMNQVMQVLAVVTTIFVPISFLAGLYGMNFENIPELKAKNGYFILLAVMLMIVLFLLYYFKRKKWF